MEKKLLSSRTTVGAGDAKALDGANSCFQASGLTTSGAGAAVVTIEVSNDRISWLTAGTISLTLGTTATSDGFTMTASWPFARAYVTSISGTGAEVSATVGR